MWSFPPPSASGLVWPRALTHDGVAEPLDIFLVPIARDASGFTYEAVFT